MLLRDKIKQQSYFDEQIEYNEQMLVKFAEIISNPNTEPTHRRRLKHTVFCRHIEQLILRYSRRESIDKLKDPFLLIVTALSDYHLEPGSLPYNFDEFNEYIFALWLVSLANLLNISDEVFNHLIVNLGNRNRDGLYEYLVKSRFVQKSDVKTLLYPKVYQHLFSAIHRPDSKQINEIVLF